MIEKVNDNKIIPPLSDFGFKNLFGKEGSQSNLIFLLNEILKGYPGMSPIVEVTYRNPDHQASTPDRKSTKFDIYCKTGNGKTFIIEMQNEGDSLIKKRLLFYLCQAVTEQDSRTDLLTPWDYDFPPVIVIMICNFIDREIDPCEVNYFGFLNLESHKPLGNHVGLVMVQLPFFPQEEMECKTELEKIFYSLTHMDTITKQGNIPFSKHSGDFYDRIAKMSQTASLTKDELHAYHQWLKVTNDDRLMLKRAEEKGLAEGEAKGRTEGRAEGEKQKAIEVARTAISMGLDDQAIQQLSGLPMEEIQKLKY